MSMYKFLRDFIITFIGNYIVFTAMQVGMVEISQCTECRARAAEIFQDSGEYCLECWQKITETNV